MRKLLLLIAAIFALTISAQATDIDIGASSITGFNNQNLGSDVAMTGVTVTLGSPEVTCTNCVPTGAVGLSGFKVKLGTVLYDVLKVDSRSAFTLTTNYPDSSGTVTGTWYKFAVLRIYVSSAFTPAGSTVVVQSGDIGSSTVFRRYAVSVINDGTQNIAYVPDILNLPATTDSDDATATYVAGLYTQGGGSIQGYPGCVDEWRLPATPTSTSWSQICAFNKVSPAPPINPLRYYTTDQIDSGIGRTCSINQLLYYASTGNVQSCLTLSSDFSITGGVISVTNALTRIQEEGSNLPQRPILNFIGSGITAADGATKTNVTVATPLNNLASNSTNGFWSIGGGGATGAARTLTGTANKITITGGDGSATPTFTISDTLDLTGHTSTAPIKAGTTPPVTCSVGQYFFDTDAPVGLNTYACTSTNTWTLQTYGLGGSNGNLLYRVSATSLGGASGANSDGTNVTFGSGNLRATSPQITTSINDSNGNEALNVTATGSAVNELTLANAATGNSPTLSASGNDTNIGININPKGTGEISQGGPLNITTAAAGSANPLELFETGDGTSRFSVSPDGKMTFRAGNGATPSTDQMSQVGLYNVDFTDRANSGTGETDLFNQSTGANVLATNGDCLIGLATVAYTNNANAKRLRVYFGSTVIYDSSSQTSLNNLSAMVILIVIRETSSTARCGVMVYHGNTVNPSGVGLVQRTLVTSLDYTSAITLKFTGVGGATNDVTQNTMIVLKGTR